MDLLLLVKAPGYIFGPLILLGGVAAVAACAWASWWPSRAAGRRAVAWALVPLAVGVAGAAFGGAHWWLSGRVVEDRAFVWSLLGYTALFGALVGAVPLVWAATLARRHRAMPA